MRWFDRFTLLGSALVFVLAAPSAHAVSDPNELCTGDPCVISQDAFVDNLVLLDFGARNVVLQAQLSIDSGTVSIVAGSFLVEGNGRLLGQGSTGNDGGDLSIFTTGDIQLSGSGSVGTAIFTGFSGGSLLLDSTGGSVLVTNKLNLDHNAAEGAGGSLGINAAGNVSISDDVILRGGNLEGGGFVDIVADGDVSVTGNVVMNGGEFDGGGFDIVADGSVTIGDIDADGSGDAGGGGFISVISLDDITVGGLIRARGSGSGFETCGEGGSVSLDTIGHVEIANEILVNGRAGDCCGGDIDILSDTTSVNGRLQSQGNGIEGCGGGVDILAETALDINQPIEVDAALDAGIVILDAPEIDVNANIDAFGRSAVGSGSPFLDISAERRVRVAPGVRIDSRGGGNGSGGEISVDACNITLEPGSELLADQGTAGNVLIVAADSLAIHGTVSVETGALIDLRYGTRADPPNLAGASFSPSPLLALHPELASCILCELDTECDDQDPCTDDSCDMFAGCLNVLIPNCDDSDGDGTPDFDDICTLRDWTPTPLDPPNQNPLKLGFQLKKISESGSGQLAAKGFFNPAAGGPELNPASKGLHIALEDSAGTLYEADVPGGIEGSTAHCGAKDGWTTKSGSRPSWKYRNRSGRLPPGCSPGSARGLNFVQFKDLRSNRKAAIQFKLLAKDMDFDHVPALPLTKLQLTVTPARHEVGNASEDAIGGQCAEALITGNPIPEKGAKPNCKVRLKNGALDQISCKGP